MSPRTSIANACNVGSVATQWTYPDQGPQSSQDARGLIVGRWVTCGQGTFGSVPHAGIEFGANGRWRLLIRDAAGALVPVGSTSAGNGGRYYALSSGQLDVAGEGFDDGTRILFVKFAAGLDAIRFEDFGATGTNTSIYARTEPSPLNGRDNVPSITDGRCSMVGTWDLAATPQSPSASFSFDTIGNFVGGPIGSDLCAGHGMYGTYRLSPGLFQLTSNIGMGVCSWWFDAGYPATFDGTCSHVTLVQHFDNCTGGRGYLNGQTILTRRP